MAGTTSPWNIPLIDDDSPGDPDTIHNGLAEAVNDALTLAKSEAVASGRVAVANSTDRDAMFPSPQQGDSVLRRDLGYAERYYAAWHTSTNPGGATSAGWYPEPGTDIVRYYTRGSNQSWTSTSWYNALTPSWTNMPAGKYRVTCTIYLQQPSTAADVDMRGFSASSSAVPFYVGHVDSDGSGPRVGHTLVGFYNHTGGTLKVEVGVLSIVAGTKQVYAYSNMAVEYVGPTR